jgi:hypothetical protein
MQEGLKISLQQQVNALTRKSGQPLALDQIYLTVVRINDVLNLYSGGSGLEFWPGH